MADERLEAARGRKTTGHEWNGIEELETRIPRIILFFLAATILFSVIYWILMPAWPTGRSYTKGVLGVDQREVVMREVRAGAAQRAALRRDALLIRGPRAAAVRSRFCGASSSDAAPRPGHGDPRTKVLARSPWRLFPSGHRGPRLVPSRPRVS